MSAVAATVACLLAQGCDPSGPFGPIDPSRVVIEMSVGGGFVGAQYAFSVDGDAGVARGDSCLSFCTFQTGEVLAELSASQIEDLAARLEAAGIVGLDDVDFGDECCDQFGYSVSYRHGERRGSFSGTSSRLPTELLLAAQHLLPLAERRVPTLVSPMTVESDWPRDGYALGDVEVSGATLIADLSYGGGCARHPMDLVALGGWMESNPVQINVLITHDDNDDACDAWLSEERMFALGPLIAAYREAYPSGFLGPQTIRLRLIDPFGEPAVRELDLTF